MPEMGGSSNDARTKTSPVGDTSGNWKACWTVPGTGGFSGNGAGYWGFYSITGPKGLPYK